MIRAQAQTGPLAGWDVKILNTSQCDHCIIRYKYSRHKHKLKCVSKPKYFVSDIEQNFFHLGAKQAMPCSKALINTDSFIKIGV